MCHVPALFTVLTYGAPVHSYLQECILFVFLIKSIWALPITNIAVSSAKMAVVLSNSGRLQV